VSSADSGDCLWDELHNTPDAEWREMLAGEKDSAEDWRMLARRGGFPTPALDLTTAADRRIWFDGYVRTYLERDLQDLASISTLPDFRRLMRGACLRMGQLVNQTNWAATLRFRSPPCIAGSTCSRPLTCWCACLPMP